ncbi:MAG: alpha/beta hydrolase [Candidatus Krumholzibacteria bacterium]|nr:alpha/beta hydrolase [Candidatus Krumholzibacteria bacterium]
MTRLGDIRAKTLILIGNKDVPSFQSLSATAAREIPNARMMVIPDVAHMINMEKPETFNRILLEYLEDK